jgi:hypothetical protein
MKYLKDYTVFMNENASGDVVEVTAKNALHLDKEAQKRNVDLEDEKVLASIIDDITKQIDISNPNPKIMVDFGVQKIKESKSVNESAGATGTVSSLEKAIQWLELIFSTGEISETTSHNVLGHLGHHGKHHTTVEEVEEAKHKLEENKSGILNFFKKILTFIKGVSNFLINSTLGLFERVIVWTCRNVFGMNVSSSGQAGKVGLALIAILLFFFTLNHASHDLVDAFSSTFSAIVFSKIVLGFLHAIKIKGGLLAQLGHSILGILRTLGLSKKAKAGKNQITILEFADIIEDLLARTYNVANYDRLKKVKIKKGAGEHSLVTNIESGDEVLPKYFRTDIDSRIGYEKGVTFFTKTTHIQKLQAISSHLSSDDTEYLSDYFTEIINKKDWSKISEIPYFNQATKSFENKEITSKDITKGDGFWSRLGGIGVTKLEKWIEQLIGKSIYKEDEKFAQNVIQPELDRLTKLGIKPTFEKDGEIDYDKYQNRANFLYKAMKGIGNYIDMRDFREYVENEADWKLIFFAFGLKSGKNLIWWFFNELPKSADDYKAADLEDIKDHLARVGCKNVDKDFEYFRKNVDKLTIE